MNRNEFSRELRRRLTELKNAEVNKTVEFYNEMIDERIDAGLTEEEAVADLGSIDDIVAQVKNNAAPENIKSRISKLQVWQWVLIVLGAPLWAPVLVAVFAAVFSIYIGIWSVLISGFAVVLGFVLAAIAFIVVMVGAIIAGLFAKTILYVGGALICASLAIFIFIAVYGCTKLVIKATVAGVKWVGRLFSGKKG